MNRCGHWIGCFLALMGAAALTGADFLLPAENPLGMRTYTQTVELTYPDAAAAGSAALTAAPLPYGKNWRSPAAGTTPIPTMCGCTT